MASGGISAQLAQLDLLKHIPCPRGEACTAYRCLFRHAADEARLPGEQANADPDAPRKRIKLSSGEYDPTSPPVPLEAVAPAKAAKATLVTPVTPANTTRTLGTAASTLPDQPVSLQLKRKVDTVAGVSKAGNTILPAVRTNAAPRKPETLNPRHLGKAPAAHEIRFRLVRMLHSELARLNDELRTTGSDEDKKLLLLSPQELIWLVLDMEESCAVSKPAIYSNSIKNRIMSYKRMPLAQWLKERADIREKEVRKQQKAERGQSEAGISYDAGKDGSAPVILDTGLTPAEEAVFIRELLLTPITGLANHGYVPTVPSQAEIQKAYDAVEASKGCEQCDRCSTRFQVFPGRREEDGALASGGACTHHPGRAFFPPKTAMATGSARDNTKRFRCCGQAVGDSPGCVTAAHHVFKTSDPKRLAMLWNFAETPLNAAVPTDRAVCFDCEMGYTVHGMELIRVTATAWPGGEPLLDVLVRPVGEIIDLNSRYSGVWPDDMANALPFSAATVFSGPEGGTDKDKDKGSKDGTDEHARQLQIVSSPVVARDLLFALIRPDTPLIGHGLENDLNSMRIVHPTICDTVLLFPHPRGLPVRHGLKMLVGRHLHREIQAEPQADSGVLKGHDSAEDARAAGDLVRFKVKQEWTAKRMDGWAFVDGRLIAPSTAPGRGASGVLTEAYIEKKERR